MNRPLIKINDLFPPRRTNRFHQDKPRRKPIDMEVICGWFCAGVICVAGWMLVIQLVRWAWNHL
jgi:hypothetical protein